MARKTALLPLVLVTACDCDGAGIAQVESRLVVDPTSIDFGILAANERAERTLTLTNEGRTELDLALFSDAPFDLGAWPRHLAPGETVEVDVIFSGAPSGDHSGRIVLRHDVEGPRDVSLHARIGAVAECWPSVEPEAIHFDGFDSAPVLITNEGGGPCTVEALGIEGAGFEVATSAPIAIPPGGTVSITVRRTDGTEATLVAVIDGDAWEIELTAPVEGPHLCVAPQAITFGAVAETRDLRLESCGGQPVVIDAIAWSTTVPELALANLPALPLALDPGAAYVLQVRYAAADTVADSTMLVIQSNALTPRIDVPVTSAPEMLPEEVGRFLYFWRVTEAEGSNIMKLPLQGTPSSTPFWGESTGQGCPGCHQISPDGRYVAMTELDELDTITTYVVDTTNNQRIDLAGPASAAIGFSWRPDVGGTPAYRFVYSTEGRIRIGSLFGGDLGELAGANANDPELGQAMPTWGSSGLIAFVRGWMEEGGFGFWELADLYTIPETGGTATPLAGASNNGKTSYYPTFSPDARWIAFTETELGDTYAAVDARVRLVRSDGSGVVVTLDALNGPSGATTFPSWSVDGTFLSVSSNRAGGAGDWDVYVAPIDPITGADSPAASVPGANTAGFEHGAQWSR